MIQIKDLLFRFQNTLFAEEEKIEAIRSVISEIIKIPIKKEDVFIKNNSIFLKIKPIFKNEILLKKEKIFFELEKNLGGKVSKELF